MNWTPNSEFEVLRTGLQSIGDRDCEAFWLTGDATLDPGYDCTGYVGTVFDPLAQYPEIDGQYYFARGAGPLPLVGAADYGRFSEWVFGDKMRLLEYPNMIFDEPSLAIGVAVWRYMGVFSKAPSLHDIVVGAWQPTAAEAAHGLEATSFNAFMNALWLMQGNPGSCADDPELALNAEAWTRMAEVSGITYDTTVDHTCLGVAPWPSTGAYNDFSQWFVKG